MKSIIFTLASLGAVGMANAAIVAADDFESNSTAGGSGWVGDWTISGGNYMAGTGLIDGTYSLGLFGQANVASRLVSPTISTSGDLVTIGWSLRAGWDVAGNGGSEIGMNILNSSSSVLLTLKFVAGTTSLTLNDGGNDFARSITFSEGSVYDFTFTSAIGASSYSFTVNRDNGAETDAGNNFAYQAGRTTNNIGGLQFFVTAPTGEGNDGFLDSVSVAAVPEPSHAMLAGLGALGLALRRRRHD